MYYFGGIIKDRYDDEIKDLLCEETFLKELLEKIDNYLKGNEYKLSSYNLKKEILKQRKELGDEDLQSSQMKQIMDGYFWK